VAAQKSTGNILKLKPGSVLKIHVDDTAQLLDQKTKEDYLPDLVMGGWSGGMFYAAHVAAKAGPLLRRRMCSEIHGYSSLYQARWGLRRSSSVRQT
jgi:hypothetical protein